MGDHGEPAQAEQIGAAVGVGIEPLPQAAAPRAGSAGLRASRGSSWDLLAEPLEHRLDRSLEQLQADVPREAVADDDVAAAAQQLAALDVAAEVEVALGASSACASSVS